MHMYNTYGVNLSSLHFVVCAETLENPSVFVAVAGVQLYSWFSIMSPQGCASFDIKSLCTETTPVVQNTGKLKWLEKRPRGFTKAPTKRPTLKGIVMYAPIYAPLCVGLACCVFKCFKLVVSLFIREA